MTTLAESGTVSRFEALIAADERIEPRDEMPDAYR